MSISDIVEKMPCWYKFILIALSLFYAYRGIMEQSLLYGTFYQHQYQRIIILYIQEFLFKVIITASGFIALFIANCIFSSVDVSHIEAGTAIILVFLMVWGVVGISGYLTLLIITGRVPGGGVPGGQ
jgi:hypothetical protein